MKRYATRWDKIALAEFHNKYTPDQNYVRLKEIYEEAIEDHKN